MTKEKNGIGGGEVPDVVKVNEVSQEELEKKLESGGIIGKFVNITTGKIMGIVVAGGIVFMAMGNSANAFPGPNIWGGVKEMVKDATGGPRVKFIGTTPRPKEQKKPKEQKLAFNLGAGIQALGEDVKKSSLVARVSVRQAEQAEAELTQDKAELAQDKAELAQEKAELAQMEEEIRVLKAKGQRLEQEDRKLKALIKFVQETKREWRK